MARPSIERASGKVRPSIERASGKVRPSIDRASEGSGRRSSTPPERLRPSIEHAPESYGRLSTSFDAGQRLALPCERRRPSGPARPRGSSAETDADPTRNTRRVDSTSFGAQLRRDREYERAAEQHRAALAIVRELDDPRTEALTLNNLALALVHTGSVSVAVENFEQALVLLRISATKGTRDRWIANLGFVRRRQGRDEDARSLLTAALDKLPWSRPAYRQVRRAAPTRELKSSAGCLDDRDRAELAQRRQACERLSLELPDALARQIELVPDRLERPRLALEAEAQLEDAPLALRQSVERLAHALAAERLLRLVERIGGLAVGEQVAELALVVRSRPSGSARRTRARRRAPRRRAASEGRSPRPAPSFVASRPSSTSSRRAARESFCWRSTTCTGTRIVRA